MNHKCFLVPQVRGNLAFPDAEATTPCLGAAAHRPFPDDELKLLASMATCAPSLTIRENLDTLCIPQPGRGVPEHALLFLLHSLSSDKPSIIMSVYNAC